MYNQEHKSQLTADGGEVHQLESRKSALETYETFYQLYGEDALQNYGFSTILNRVLHMDETEDRSTHFVIAKADVPKRQIREHYDRLGVPAHFIPYKPNDIIVASTDGNLITEYDVVSAYGMYRAHLNDTDSKYDPHYETMELSLLPSMAVRSINHVIRAEFNLGTGYGTVAMGERPCGWVLSDQESTRIRNIILTPALTQSVGHTAMAS